METGYLGDIASSNKPIKKSDDIIDLAEEENKISEHQENLKKDSEIKRKLRYYFFECSRFILIDLYVYKYICMYRHLYPFLFMCT
jgi:ribosomal protein S15P/S13E